MNSNDLHELAVLSGGTEDSVILFITDINKLLDMGLWWSDAHDICLALKDYGFNMTAPSWSTFLDRLVGAHTVSNREPLTTSPIFMQEDFK